MKWKKFLVKASCILAVIVISIGSIWRFSLELQHALTAETYRTLSEVSIDYNKAFLDSISYNIKTLKVLAGSLIELPEQQSKPEMIRILQSAVDSGAFSEVTICDANGIGCSNGGKSVNVSSRDYFQTAMRGETEISEPLFSAINGDSVIVFAVPIPRNGNITGVLLGVYPLSTAGAQLLDFTYYSEGYGFIVAPDGTILLSSEHTDKLANEKNLFSFFEKVHFIDFSLEELKTAMQQGESKSFAFTYHDERRFVSFTPSTINNWYTFSLSSDALMLQQERITREIVIELILSLSVFGSFLMIWIAIGHQRHNKELLAANQKYQSLLSHINGGMIVAHHAKTAEETLLTYVSPGFTDMTGYTLEEIQREYHGQYLELVRSEERATVFQKYLEQIENDTCYRIPYRIHKKDGSFLWVMDNGYLVNTAGGLYNHSILTDISLLKQQEEELRMSESRFSVAINASSGCLFEVDLKQQRYTHFENAERIFGVGAEKLLADTSVFASLPYDEFLTATTHYFFHPEDYILAQEAMNTLFQGGTANYEARLRRFSGSFIWAHIDLSLVRDEFGAPSRLIGFMSDIDAMKKQSARLESKVQTDPMTGLYNKIAMATLSDKVLKDYPDGRHALMVIDVDNFKGINDTLGHAFGDLVLMDVCTKLSAAFRTNDIVGRMGGDEFAVLMKNVPNTGSVLKKAAGLSGVFRQTYRGESTDYKLSCSIGVIMIEAGCRDTFEALYRKADAALYKAKQRGKDQVVLYRDTDSDNYSIESTRTNDEERQNLKASHDIATHIFELLYAAKDFHVGITEALAAIGQQYHVSRVSIFENDHENLTLRNIYEWCNAGISPKVDQLQNISILSGDESIMDSFDHNGLLYCSDVRELPPYLRQLLESQDIVSTLQVTITNGDKICGFIGFDECRDYRIWTSEEIEKLSFLSKVLSVFLFKKKAETSLLDNLHTRLQILDVLPDYICVVNPETHMLEYTNKKMKELFPAATSNAFCFSTLRGGATVPCSTCIVERIKQGDTDNLEIISEDRNIRLKVNALSINWTKDQKMVLLYGTQQ